MRYAAFGSVLLVLVASACQSTGDKPAKTGPGDSAAVLALGKVVYEVHCMRCHGPDGKDETYPFIARLDGIGRHML